MQSYPMNLNTPADPSAIDRRQMLVQSAGLIAAGSLAAGNVSMADEAKASTPVVKNGNIRQSLVHWCFSKYWDVEKTCHIAR